ncbi:MAG: hypothetical protein EBY70_09000 [Burkholderiaceae bacterium]|nr:hypothetical protein [Burkholderiaceae bacterium]
MATAIKLSSSFICETRPYADAMHRSIPKQIEYWARIGKIVEENPDLPFSMIQDILISIEEVKAGKYAEYTFG